LAALFLASGSEAVNEFLGFRQVDVVGEILHLNGKAGGDSFDFRIGGRSV
jgi:hypothetical protein